MTWPRRTQQAGLLLALGAIAALAVARALGVL